MEQALFLARMAEKVTVIHRRDTFKASKAMASRVLSHPNIEILWDTSVVEFIKATPDAEGSALGGGDHDALQALRIVTRFDEETDAPNEERNASERILPVDGAFVSIGLTPNTQLFDALKRDEYGYIYTVPGACVAPVPCYVTSARMACFSGSGAPFCCCCRHDFDFNYWRVRCRRCGGWCVSPSNHECRHWRHGCA